MAVGIDLDRVERVGLVAGQWVELVDRLHLVAEQGQAPGAVLVVGGKDVNGVAAHPEGAALEGGIVALVLQLDQLLQQVGAVDVLSGLHLHRRSEEHTSELQSLMRISYAVFCLKKKK